MTWGCGSNVGHGGGAIDATSREQTAGHVPVVAGTTTPSVARAIVRSEVGRRLRRHAWACHLSGFRGPAGEGRRCYSRPRVTRVRLLDPARVDKTSQLRIVATYSGGYIGSIDVNVGGRGSAHADLVETSPLRAGGRRVVTLPVSFTRRGTVGVDVTAEGLPLSRRCGERPPLRRSAAKTLRWSDPVARGPDGPAASHRRGGTRPRSRRGRGLRKALEIGDDLVRARHLGVTAVHVPQVG